MRETDFLEMFSQTRILGIDEIVGIEIDTGFPVEGQHFGRAGLQAFALRGPAITAGKFVEAECVRIRKELYMCRIAVPALPFTAAIWTHRMSKLSKTANPASRRRRLPSGRIRGRPPAPGRHRKPVEQPS